MAILKEAGVSFFEMASQAIQKNGVDIKKSLDEIKTNLSLSGKKLFQPIRIALTGLDHGPELMNIAMLLGVDKMQQRLQYAAHIAGQQKIMLG
jgi:glutamyl/glutaminyl-tRNA synthetase